MADTKFKPFDGWTLEQLEERAALNRIGGIRVSPELRAEIQRRREPWRERPITDTDAYRLPDGRIVQIYADVARGAALITFELASQDGQRRIVHATRVPLCETCGEPAGAGGALCPACAAAR